MMPVASNTHTPDARSTGGSAARVEEAPPSVVHGWLRSGEAVLIDVREPDEHARERISGARLAPLSRLDPSSLRIHVEPGQRLVFHCRGGHRSAEAARAAAATAGLDIRIVSMTGGIEAWKKARLPVAVDTRACGVSVMRQVQMVIGGGVVAGAALAWLVHPAFLAIPALLGAGLVFAGVTGACGLAAVLARMPWNRGGGGRGSCAIGG